MLGSLHQAHIPHQLAYAIAFLDPHAYAYALVRVLPLANTHQCRGIAASYPLTNLQEVVMGWLSWYVT
jgi:hypothetical protein